MSSLGNWVAGLPPACILIARLLIVIHVLSPIDLCLRVITMSDGSRSACETISAAVVPATDVPLSTPYSRCCRNHRHYSRNVDRLGLARTVLARLHLILISSIYIL
jgi:hypothetical protein